MELDVGSRSSVSVADLDVGFDSDGSLSIYQCQVGPPGVAFRSKPEWEARVDRIIGPRSPMCVSVDKTIEDAQGLTWLRTKLGYLPATNLDGSFKCFVMRSEDASEEIKVPLGHLITISTDLENNMAGSQLSLLVTSLKTNMTDITCERDLLLLEKDQLQQQLAAEHTARKLAEDKLAKLTLNLEVTKELLDTSRNLRVSDGSYTPRGGGMTPRSRSNTGLTPRSPSSAAAMPPLLSPNSPPIEQPAAAVPPVTPLQNQTTDPIAEEESEEESSDDDDDEDGIDLDALLEDNASPDFEIEITPEDDAVDKVAFDPVVRADILTLYGEHCPDKTEQDIEAILTKFSGRESQLLQMINQKYVKPKVAKKDKVTKKVPAMVPKLSPKSTKAAVPGLPPRTPRTPHATGSLTPRSRGNSVTDSGSAPRAAGNLTPRSRGNSVSTPQSDDAKKAAAAARKRLKEGKEKAEKKAKAERAAKGGGQQW